MAIITIIISENGVNKNFPVSQGLIIEYLKTVYMFTLHVLADLMFRRSLRM